MARLKRLGLAIPALIYGALAQSEGDKVWAAVAFINHGERTPLLSDLRTVLTPEGAQQMWRQGTAFRARYLKDSVNDTDYEDIQTAFLQGLNLDVIDNIQLDLISKRDEWVSAGALAFMQGFYPPSDAFDNSTGGLDLARDFTLGDNKTDYPLGGYQYPNIRTIDIVDPEFAALQGTERCSAWDSEQDNNFTKEDLLDELFEKTFPFYQNLFSTPPLEGVLPLDKAHFWEAYEIWDYVDYMYRHNETVNEGLQDPNTTLSFLNTYAMDLVRQQNSYLQGEGEDDPLDVLYSIAGRTLAYKVTQQFVNNIRWGGARDKLTLMFGSLEPIVSFISLSGLLTRENIFKEPFSSIPKPGAALVFELYGQDPDFPDEMPTHENLFMRLSYRPSADPDEAFANMPLFDSGPDGVPYAKFMNTMQDIGRTPDDWCNICGPTPAPWCLLLTDADNIPLGGRSELEPAIAGVIGAVIMLAIMGLIFTGLYVLGGVRLGRKAPPPEPQDDSAAVGGFKGSERKEGDPDVVVSKAGIHHERVGSWELRGGSSSPPQTVGIVTKDMPSESRRSFDDDDISVLGATPVKERENV